ncbi:MAG: ABC transporter ATP-binding protein [Tepidisphaeraceae bacterium]|jgi:putative ABC transport system ATP-binding protein
MFLELTNLKKHYRGPDGSETPVVDIPHFRIEHAQQVALVGSSGSGKTTLLHLVAGILTPDSGSVVFTDSPGNGSSGSPATPMLASAILEYRAPGSAADAVYSLARMSEGRRDVFRGRYLGYIFQTHHLLGGLTAMENVLLGMSFTGRPADRDWAKHLLTAVGLADRLDYRPAKLSLGQQQRVAVARALANRPAIVLADEPTGSLDAVNAQQVVQLIRSLCQEVGAMLLLVSHDPAVTGQFQTVIHLTDINRAAAPVMTSA